MHLLIQDYRAYTDVCIMQMSEMFSSSYCSYPSRPHANPAYVITYVVNYVINHVVGKQLPAAMLGLVSTGDVRMYGL